MTDPIAQNLPGKQISDGAGNLLPAWLTFFLNLLNRTGGATGNPSSILDILSNVPGSILFRASQLWQGLVAGAQFEVLLSDGGSPGWSLLSANSFSPVGESDFLVGPVGGAGQPTFRQIATSDLDVIAGQFPATGNNDNAEAGNIGEYVFSEVVLAHAVMLASGTSTDVTSITLGPGDWQVWATFVTAPAVTTTQSDIRAWISTTSGTDPGPPNLGAYAELNTPIAAGLSQTLAVGMTRVSVPSSGSETVYLSTNATFATSTLSGYGFLGARRPR